jgi:endonuclease YncB( thermonuclease family)
MTPDTDGTTHLRKFWKLVFSMAALCAFVGTDRASAEAQATEIRGMAEVIDADILTIGRQRVILWGIDAPERRQTCFLNSEIWGCYDVAFRQLQLLAGRGEVVCYFHGDPDPFGRRFGVCESGGADLNAEMVRLGLALAYEEETDAYLPQMAEAIAASVGLWQIGARFEEPWAFRRRETPGGFR